MYRQYRVILHSKNTMSYGISNTPYLAKRTLQQLADDEGEDFPKTASTLRTQTYVDDVITGANAVEEAMELQDLLIGLLRTGCVELRKWSSNSNQLY